jgi:DNA-directed RNA polymerase subunit RPC12/RpoP
MRTAEMFDKPRKKHEWLMHVCDAHSADDGVQDVRFKCNRCGHETEWTEVATVTAAKRGLPCPLCNGEGE